MVSYGNKEVEMTVMTTTLLGIGREKYMVVLRAYTLAISRKGLWKNGITLLLCLKEFLCL